MSDLTLYRKKPVVVEAMLWDGEVAHAAAILDWVNSTEATATWTSGHTTNPGFPDEAWVPNGIYIRTLEGTMHVSPGDYVIRGVQGEFYPCKPDIFEKTYEKA